MVTVPLVAVPAGFGPATLTGAPPRWKVVAASMFEGIDQVNK
jgi:hypothetical protein